MTNALTILQGGDLQLTEMEQLIQGEKSREQSAYDMIPTRIKIAPGGVNVFSTNDGETFKKLRAILVISQKARAYWPEQGTGQPPMCTSPDGSKGFVSGEITDAHYRSAVTAKEPHPVIRLLDSNKVVPAHFDCLSCPLSQWNSAHQGGKQGRSIACKYLRRLVVLKEGWSQPAILTLPPTSVKNLDIYASSLDRNKMAYWAVWTDIALEVQKSNNGEPYSVATFNVHSPLKSKDELFAVIDLRRQFEELVRSMPIDNAEYDVVDGTSSTSNADVVIEPDDDRTPPF